MRKLKEKDVTFRLEVEQDPVDPRGNVMASGDDAADREAEDEVNRRLNNGDVWAWASVHLIAEWEGIEGHDYLGGCNYADEADFKTPGGYYDDMKAVALAELNAKVSQICKSARRRK